MRCLQQWTDVPLSRAHHQLSSKVAGHAAQVYVSDNQEIRQGDLLVEIDPRGMRPGWRRLVPPSRPLSPDSRQRKPLWR
jgi:multidrug resistance efflux pump